MIYQDIKSMEARLKGVLTERDGRAVVASESSFRGTLTDDLVETAVFARDPALRARARYTIKQAAAALGVRPASIHDLYAAMGHGEAGGFTVPAMNLRGLAYDSGRAFFRAALAKNCGAFIFEIAKSEIGYTDQRPGEYVAVMLGAALREGYRGPVFIQGDHFQASAKSYFKDPAAELEGLKTLILEALTAGFYNIDIDSSTLVVLERPDTRAQQKDNADVCAALTRTIRANQPEGVTVSVGGEIGEVGGHNSTVEEFTAFMEGYLEALGESEGISKISVQTGTSHGGVVRPDGTVAEVKLDFDVLTAISRVARSRFGLGGTVQHGASTLPDDAFHHFPEHEACEVHLATGFQNIIYDHPELPDDFREHVYAHLRETCAGERKEGQTEEQFLYKTRKKGFGPLKRDWWNLPKPVRGAIGQTLEEKFAFLIDQLRVGDTREVVDRFVTPAAPTPDLASEEAACRAVIVAAPETNPNAD